MAILTQQRERKTDFILTNEVIFCCCYFLAMLNFIMLNPVTYSRFQMNGQFIHVSDVAADVVLVIFIIVVVICCLACALSPLLSTTFSCVEYLFGEIVVHVLLKCPLRITVKPLYSRNLPLGE